MRKFGTDKPEVMSFQLGDDKKIYKMPLAASLPVSKLLEMEDVSKKNDYAILRFQIELLREHIGDVVDTLTSKDIADIFNAWNEESGLQGADTGES